MMKIEDLDVQQILGEISELLTPHLFRGIGPRTPAYVYRERMSLQAVITGRFMAVLMCGDDVGPDIVDRIEHAVGRSKEAYQATLEKELKPNGALSSR